MKRSFFKLIKSFIATAAVISLLIIPAANVNASGSYHVAGEKYRYGSGIFDDIIYINGSGQLCEFYNYDNTTEIYAENVKDYLREGSSYCIFVLYNDGRLRRELSKTHQGGCNHTAGEDIDSNIKELVPMLAPESNTGILAIKNDNTLWQYSGLGSYSQTTGRQIMTDVKAVYHDNISDYNGFGEAALFVVKNDGSLWGMGKNENGELGVGHKNPVPYERPVKIMDNVEKVSYCNGGIVYAVAGDGGLYSWGDIEMSPNCQDPTGSLCRPGDRLKPGKVMDGIKSVTIGVNIKGPRILALGVDGTLYTMGVDTGPKEVRVDSAPRKVDTNVMDMVSETWSAFYIKNDNTLWGLGRFCSGADPSVYTYAPTPRKMLDGIISVYARVGYFMAIDAGGNMWRWGTRDGGLCYGPEMIFKAVNPLPPAGPAGTIYRLFDPANGDHIYTVNLEERNSLLNAGWQLETSPGMSAASGGVPIYRLINNANREHLFTANEHEKNTLANNGWSVENGGKPVFYGSKTGKPVYRLFNPNAASAINSHHYTLGQNEIKQLTTQKGWTIDNYGKPVFYLN